MSENSNGATLNAIKSGQSITSGNSAVHNHEILTFQKGQYAKFSNKSDGINRTYVILASDEFTGYQLSVTYPISNLQTIFDQSPDLGSLGEIFLADGEGFFVTRPRFESMQGHSHPIHAQPIQSCLRGENKEVLDLDYRDQPIIHGFRFVPEFGAGCIMAHADQEEAFSQLTDFETNANTILLISIAGIIFVTWLITRRFIKSEELQRQSEIKFRTIFESANDGVYIQDLNGLIIDMNPVAHSRLGYTKDEMAGKNVVQFIQPEMAAAYYKKIEKLSIDGFCMFESAHLCKDGTVMPVEINGRLIEMDGQKKVFSINRDITMRKEIESILAKRESKYRAVIETSADGFWIVDMQGRIVEVNDAYAKLSGFSHEQLLTMSVRDLDHTESSQDTAIHIQKVMRDGNDRFESWHKKKDGNIWPVEIVVNYWNIEEGRLFVFVHDITERKKITRELEQSKQSLQTILENAPISMALCKTDGRFVYVKDAMSTLMGYSITEFEKLYIKDITHPDDRELTSDYTHSLLEGRLQIFSGEKRYVAKNGQTVWAHINASLRREASGETYLIAQIVDITDRKIAEEKIKESENKFRVLFETANDSLFILDLNGYFVNINHSGYENLGYTREEMIGKHISEIIPQDLRGGIQDRLEKVVSEGQATFDSANVHKDGTLIIVEVNAQLIRQGGVYYFFSTNRNITTRKQIEIKLREQEALSRAVIEGILDS